MSETSAVKEVERKAETKDLTDSLLAVIIIQLLNQRKETDS